MKIRKIVEDSNSSQKATLRLDESVFNDFKLTLDESLLMEGPLDTIKQLGRDAVRGVQNAFSPKGAMKRAKKDYDKDQDKKQTKANVVLSKDFSSKNANAYFYLNHDYTNPIDYEDWCNKFRNLDPSDSDDYIAWHNAIVVDKDGYYLRRGSEDMRNKLERFIPEQNDELNKFYRLEPYTYKPVRSKKTKETGKGKGKNTPKPERAGGKGDEAKPKPTLKPKPKTGEKTPPISPSDLNRFQQLCKLTSFRVYDTATKSELTFEQICKITPETLSQYFVNTKYGKKSRLDVWFKDAVKSKFLNKITEYINRFYKPALNEELLTEAPKLQLDDADLMNPDQVNFSELIKKAADKEKAEIKQKADQELRNNLANKYKNVIGIASEYSDEDPQEALSALFNVLVPPEGEADTLAGEMVRAMMRILYRFQNDGDIFYTDYGLETCASSAMYLYNHGLDVIINEVLDKSSMLDEDRYEAYLNMMCKYVVDYIINNPDTITTPNNEDSRNCDADYIVDQQPRFEFEFYGNDDVQALVDANIINSWTLKEYVEDQLRYCSYIGEFETERPWTHYDHSVTVTGLTRDALDYIENDLFRDSDGFWEGLLDDYQDELEELHNDDVDEDDEEPDFDE